VIPSDLKGFTQCHFFAGIGVWSLALRLSGWPDDRPIWTGSCPCQPFSAAGKGDGFDDERHLWPAFHWLVRCAKSAAIPLIGEQVASKDGRAWFDLVSSDMEGLDHACGAVDTCAAGLGAPFIGQRLYWLASSRLGQTGIAAGQRDAGAFLGTQDGIDGARIGQHGSDSQRYSDAVDVGRLAASHSGQRDGWAEPTRGNHSGGSDAGWPQGDGGVTTCDESRGLAPATSGQTRHGYLQSSKQHGLIAQDDRDSCDGGIPLHPVDYWRDADWLLCRDPDGSRFRPVEPGAFPLVDARSVVNRLGQVRGAGNALNVSQAACFVEVVMEHLSS
jgi:DNA (cytosine-5)-methyltransferase 1